MYAPILLAAVLVLSPLAAAQLDERWVAFELDPARVVSEQPIVDADNEADLAWADFDNDGVTDLVVARKEPFMTPGGRSNVLLLNVDGKLVDRTGKAAQSDVEGDRGFLAETNDRDVVAADLTGDGWPEVVTAVDRSPGQPKHLSHPRVYLNLGPGKDAFWHGLRYEDARFPELLHLESKEPVMPRFLAVAAGDVDADGDLDLYFGDGDIWPGEEGQRPEREPDEEDCDDRLLVNDGEGSFADATAKLVAPEVRASRYCNSVVLVDVDGDRRADLVKQNTYQRPNELFVAYAGEGGALSEKSVVYSDRPYFVSTGDLNNDGRADLVVSENGLDRHIYNLAPAERGGRPRWSEAKTFEFLFGEDDKYAGNSLVADLDGDGWRDVVITDVDPEIPDYARRTHVYHNRGGTIGGDDIVLREEREKAEAGGWVGAVGLTEESLGGAHDVAVIDVDRDGKPDLVLARKAGLEVWRQVE
jgi:hypothetical protein